MPRADRRMAHIQLPGTVATLTKPVVLHVQREWAAGAPALHSGGLAEQEKAGCCRRCRMRSPGWLLRAPGHGLIGLAPRDPKRHVRARLGVQLWGFVLVLLPPLCTFMAQRLGVHRHEERTVGRFAFYIHERKWGNRRFQRVLSVQFPPPWLAVLLPLLVLVLNKFKVIVHQVYFFR